MSFHFRNLSDLENGIPVRLPTDEDGLIGRECPNDECLQYFKIKLGTGLKGENLPCHCPYCGHVADHDQFHTSDQVEYLQSIAANMITRALQADVQDWDRELRWQTRSSFIKLSVEFKGHTQPIRSYQEKQLETKVTCDACTLEYAVYGLFAFCPDCGTHNSFQILKKNLELVEKLLTLVGGEDNPDLAELLLVKALETSVSTFDGFGRAFCAARAAQSSDPEQAKGISFQSLTRARTVYQNAFGKDFAQGLTTAEWEFVLRCFQKRHLFAHRMGIVDDDYVKKASDPDAVVGRKVKATSDEIRELAALLMKLGQQF